MLCTERGTSQNNNILAPGSIPIQTSIFSILQSLTFSDYMIFHNILILFLAPVVGWEAFPRNSRSLFFDKFFTPPPVKQAQTLVRPTAHIKNWLNWLNCLNWLNWLNWLKKKRRKKGKCQFVDHSKPCLAVGK